MVSIEELRSSGAPPRACDILHPGRMTVLEVPSLCFSECSSDLERTASFSQTSYSVCLCERMSVSSIKSSYYIEKRDGCVFVCVLVLQRLCSEQVLSA